MRRRGAKARPRCAGLLGARGGSDQRHRTGEQHANQVGLAARAGLVQHRLHRPAHRRQGEAARLGVALERPTRRRVGAGLRLPRLSCARPNHGPTGGCRYSSVRRMRDAGSVSGVAPVLEWLTCMARPRRTSPAVRRFAQAPAQRQNGRCSAWRWANSSNIARQAAGSGGEAGSSTTARNARARSPVRAASTIMSCRATWVAM